MNWSEAKAAVDRYVDTGQPSRADWMLSIQRVPYGRGTVLVYWQHVRTRDGQPVESPLIYLDANSTEADLFKAAQQSLSLIT